MRLHATCCVRSRCTAVRLLPMRVTACYLPLPLLITFCVYYAVTKHCSSFVTDVAHSHCVRSLRLPFSFRLRGRLRLRWFSCVATRYCCPTSNWVFAPCWFNCPTWFSTFYVRTRHAVFLRPGFRCRTHCYVAAAFPDVRLRRCLCHQGLIAFRWCDFRFGLLLLLVAFWLRLRRVSALTVDFRSFAGIYPAFLSVTFVFVRCRFVPFGLVCVTQVFVVA